MKSISTEKLQEIVETDQEVHLIDVREDEEVAMGMVEGAKHIPLGELPERVSELNQSVTYHIICRSGRRSANAAEFLESKGFEAVNIDGGMLEWQGETIV